MIDTSYADTSPLIFPPQKEWRIALHVADPVSTWLAPSLVRLARAIQEASETKIHLEFFGLRPIQRDETLTGNFFPGDQGAACDPLALRYGAAWDIPVKVRFSDTVRSADLLIGSNFENNASHTFQLRIDAHKQCGNVALATHPNDDLQQIAFPDRQLPKRRTGPLNLLPTLWDMANAQNVAAEAADYVLRLMLYDLKKQYTCFAFGQSATHYFKSRRDTPAPVHREIQMVVPPIEGNVHFVLVGCGGTGGWVMPSLARIARYVNYEKRSAALTLVDMDWVESKNVLRQNFCDAEVDMPKAETLASRYEPVFKDPIQRIIRPFTASMIKSLGGENIILIGCVDDHLARREMHQAVISNPGRVWWIDSGNSRSAGQILIGNSDRIEVQGGRCLALPSPGLQAPDLLDPAPEPVDQPALSCETMALHQAQSLFVNQRAAAIVSLKLVELLGGTLSTHATYFDMPTGRITAAPIHDYN